MFCVPFVDEQGQLIGLASYESICQALEQQAKETLSNPSDCPQYESPSLQASPLCSCNKAQQALQQAQAEFETRVEERTRAVKEMNKQLIFEMTDRLYAEEQLRQSQEMLQFIMDNIPQSIFWKDTASVYLGCNRIFAKMVDLESPEDIVGKTDYDLLVSEKEANLYYESDFRVMQTDTPEYRVIFPHIRKNGKQAWLEASKIPLHDHEGNVMGTLGTFEDITERKLAEESLLRFRKAIESTSDAISMTDSTGEVIYLNPAFVELFEYSLEELQVAGGLSAIYTSIAEYEQVFATVNRGDSWRGEATMKTCGGRILQVELRGNAIKDATGKVIGSVGIHTDITERKQAEESLQLRDRAIAASSNGIMIADVTMPDSPIIYANSALEQITGYSVAEVIGKNSYFLHGCDINQPGMTELHDAIAQGKSCTVVLRNYRKDGTLFWNEVSISPVYDYHAQFTHYISIQTDITERKQLEEELKAALHKEKELNELKSRFVSMTSHEFRTPLSTILSSSELLEHYRHRWTEEKQVSHLHRIQTAVKRMTEMLNNVLVIGKVEAGKLDFIPLP
ncbi:MAG: PAS domain-containing sensor histidine kinase, partial [Microcystaceae cyanobacterium]